MADFDPIVRAPAGVSNASGNNSSTTRSNGAARLVNVSADSGDFDVGLINEPAFPDNLPA